MKIRDVKESVACIYKLTFPDGKIYIGQTKDLKKRMQLYIFCNNTKATGITPIIRSFGIDLVDVEVLCRITGMNEVDERLCLNILEIHYISELNSLEPNGYNTSLGGEIFGIPNEVLAMSSDEVKNYYRRGSKPVPLVGVKPRSTRKGRHSILYNNFPIAQFTLDGELVAEYDSTRDASEATGIPYSGIYACVNGKTRKSKGYVWKKIEK